jgi:tRNA nucleotidyltransferase/poly(A) polymerase
MAVLETLWHNGHGAYLVGGGLRDTLLGLPVSDWDVATDARPERIMGLFPDGTYENRFGTVQARGLEITTFRRDHRYADHRRPDSVTFSDDIYEDLARRDLTINAIAWGRRGPGAAPRLVDPADGQGDLRARLVRAVGNPGRRFEEDALRLLRAVRIAARLEFDIEPLTHAAIRAHAADVAWVSEERVGSEVRGMLEMAKPSRAFVLLHGSGLLATTLPELLASTDAGSPGGEDTLARALDSLDAAVAMAPGNERLAMAALLSEAGPTVGRGVLERLRVSGRDGDAICTLIEAASVPYETAWSDADVRRYLGRIPRESIADVEALRRARRMTAGQEALWLEDELMRRVAAQRAAQAPLSLAELAIDGHDLQDALGVAEGPAIGLVLERLLDEVLEEPSLNRRPTLLARAGLVLGELAPGGSGEADARPSGSLDG